MPSVHHEINQITHNVRGQPYEFQIVALYGEVVQTFTARTMYQSNIGWCILNEMLKMTLKRKMGEPQTRQEVISE